MEYKLGLWQTIEVLCNVEMIIVVISGLVQLGIISMILYVFLYTIMRNHSKVRKIVLMSAFILSLSTTLGLFIFPIFGSGWQISDNKLHIKSCFHSDDIDISSIDMGFVDNNGSWQPILREMGLGLPQFMSGNFRLANKKTVLLFDYKNQEKLLLITANKKYYLIGYPGIEKLHAELLKLGAKEKQFEK